jgi:hypothetical protein
MQESFRSNVNKKVKSSINSFLTLAYSVFRVIAYSDERETLNYNETVCYHDHKSNPQGCAFYSQAIIFCAAIMI